MAAGCAQRFLVDYMLGRLVTWLRLLGCDTVYAGAIDDAAIARLAQQDNVIGFQTQERFLRCAVCGHIYWRGTHREEMQKRLARLPSET
jgi:uncharacterized protein